MDDFWDEFDAEAEQTASPNDNRDPDPEVTDRSVALMATFKLLNHGKADPRDGSPRSLALDQVQSRFWLMLAQFTAALNLPEASGPRFGPADRGIVEEAEVWIQRVLKSAPFDVQVLHGVATILFGFYELAGLEDRKAYWVKKACELLDAAVRLAPGRFDLLTDLATMLSLKAEQVPPAERTALLREAAGRFDEAARCFGPKTRRVPASGEFHPAYRLATCCASTLNSLLARESDDEEECSRLFRQAYRQISQTHLDLPFLRFLRGRAALDLAWLPGRTKARRKLFDEACRYLRAAAESNDPKITDGYTHWACATVGRAAVATTDEDAQRHVERAVELFERATQEAKGEEGVESIAARAWLMLANECSGENEQAAARRAADSARRCNRMEPGSGDYNLACALSRMGKPAEASKALLAALAREPEDAAHALRDPDLERLWEARPKLRQVLAARVPTDPKAGAPSRGHHG